MDPCGREAEVVPEGLGVLEERQNLDELLDQTKNVLPPRPSEIRPERQIPEELENICMRCVQKDPDDRIQTAAKLVNALRAWRIRWSATNA